MKGWFEIRKKDGSLVFEVFRNSIFSYNKVPGVISIKWENPILDKWIEEYLFARQGIQKLKGYTLNDWLFFYPIKESVLRDLFIALENQNFRFCPNSFEFIQKDDNDFLRDVYKLTCDIDTFVANTLNDDEEFVYVSDKDYDKYPIKTRRKRKRKKKIKKQTNLS